MQNGVQLPFRSRPLNSIPLQTASQSSQSTKAHLILRLCTEKWQDFPAVQRYFRREAASKWLLQRRTGELRRRRREALAGLSAVFGDGWIREPTDAETAEREGSPRLRKERLNAEIKRMKEEMERRGRVAREAPASAKEAESEAKLQRFAPEALSQLESHGKDIQSGADARSEEEVEYMDFD